MKNRIKLLVLLVTVILTASFALVVLLITSCISQPSTPVTSTSMPPTSTTASPASLIVGEWKLEGLVSEVGVSAGTTGKINGENYLFLGTGSNGPPPESAIRILSLKDHRNPIQVGILETVGQGIPIIGLQLSGTTLFASTLSSSSIWIVDVSNPAAPKELSKISSLTSLNTAVSGKYVYDIDYDKITVLDVSNLTNPKVAGNLGLRPLAMKATDTLLLAVARDGLHIIDISSPQSLKERGSFSNPGGVAPANWDTLPLDQRDLFMDIDVSGRYAYIASGISGLRVLDISNPSAPIQVSKLKTEGVASRIHVSGTFAYLIDWRKPLSPDNPLPLLVIDISDPNNPKEIASVEFPPYFNFNFVEANGYIYYFGNDPSIKIADVSRLGK